MAESNLEEIFSKLTLGGIKNKSFVENAVDMVTKTFGCRDWIDNLLKFVSYKWSTPSLREKFGDQAEETVLKRFGSAKFCELLGEPVYIISGT